MVPDTIPPRDRFRAVMNFQPFDRLLPRPTRLMRAAQDHPIRLPSQHLPAGNYSTHFKPFSCHNYGKEYKDIDWPPPSA